MQRMIVAIVASMSLAVSLCLLACGDRPQPKPPEPARVSPTSPQPQAAPRGAAPIDERLQRVSGPDDDPALMEVGGIAAPKPPQWTWQQPSMQFRTLQYAVPAPGESTGSAELIVSVFLGDDGGPLDTNIARWVGQFRSAAGQPVEPIREERDIDGMRVILLELAGSYQGMGGAGPKPEFMQLGAIIDAPQRRVFIRLLGPASTVEANRQAWKDLIEGMRDATK